MKNPVLKLVTLRMAVNAGFALALIILLATQWMLYRTIHFMVSSDTWEKNTYVDINIYDRFLSSLKDIETGERGYIITGDTTYLEPYYAGIGNLKTIQNTLRTLAFGNPIQQERLTLIDSLVYKKQNIIKGLVELRRSNRFTTASVIAQTHKGKLIMDAIRKQVGESRYDEEQILNKSKDAKKANLHTMLSILIMSIIFVFAILIVVFFILKKEIVQRMNAEQKLLKQQDSLNERIVARTAELQETNDSLRNARRAALNMMEDAIAARKEAEMNGALLKGEIIERNKAEKDVRESEERFRIIADKISIGLVMTRQSDSRIVFANPAYHEMLGLRPGELLGQKGPDIYFDPKDNNALIGTLKKQGYLKDYAIQIRKRDSAPMWVLSTVQAIEYKGEPVLMGSYVDITDRKNIEDALKKSEERYRALTDNIPDQIMRLDKDHRLIYANPAVERRAGLPQEKLIGKTPLDYGVAFNNAIPWRNATQEAFLSGKLQKVELSNELNGDTRVFDAQIIPELGSDGTVLSVIIIAHDITSRKLAEETIRKSEQRLKFHLENSPLAVIEWDAEYIVTQWTHEAEKMYGWTKEEVLGKPINALNMIYIDDVPIVSGTMELLSSGKQNTVVSTNRNYTKSGNVIECTWYNSVVLDEHGKMASVMSLVQDITVQKQAQENLRLANVQLKESNAELDAFNYSVSHDLRGPLHIISMFSQLLVNDYEEILDEDGKIYIRHITQSTGRMTQIIDDMQKLSQISRAEIHCSYVNLSEIARTFVREQYLYDVERDVEFCIADDIVVYADSGLMTIVMDNLCRNAWKFTSKQTHARIEFSSEFDGKNIVCCMRDNGVGFNMAQAEKLFMPFKRLHTVEEFPGTGIGLVIVRRIIERHGGRVWAEGEVDKGAVVYFELPVGVDNKENGGGVIDESQSDFTAH